MSSFRTASLVGAIVVTAGAARRIIMQDAIIPIPMGAWFTGVIVLWVAFFIAVARDDIVRHMEKRENELMLTALSTHTSGLRRVK